MINPINTRITPNFTTTHQASDSQIEMREICSFVPDLILQENDVNTPKPVQAKHLVAPLLEDFIEDESKFRKYLELALSLNSEELGNTQEVLNKMVPGVIEEIIKEGLEKTKHSNQIKENTNILDFNAQLATPLTFEEGFIKNNPGLEIGVVGINILSRGSSVMALGILMHKIHEAIVSKENFLVHIVDQNERIILQNKIEILTKWLEVHSILFSEMLKESLIESAFSLPKVASGIAALAQATGTVVSVIDWIGMGIGLVGSAIGWYFNQKNFDKHETWTKIISDDGNSADQIYQRQKEIFEKRLETNLPTLDKFLKSINEDLEGAKNTVLSNQEKVRDKILERLREAGIELLEEMPTLETLQTALSNPADKKSMNIMMVKKKEMLSVTLRNSLKAFNQKKNEIDTGFLENTLDKSSGFFMICAYITSWTIVLETLLSVELFTSALVIAALGTILSVLGYVALAGLVISVILGSIYLHLKKPNIFKTYIQGVQARLFFWNIPLAIQRFRKNCVLLEDIKVYGEVQEIGIRILKMNRLLHRGNPDEVNAFLSLHLSENANSGHEVKQILEGYKQELENTYRMKVEEWKVLSEKVAGLNQSIMGLEEKVKPLQNQIHEAGWKDFLFNLREKKLESDGEIELVKIGKLSKKPVDDLRALTEHLLQDETLLQDSKTKKILLNMGVDLTRLKEFSHKEDPEVVIREISKRISGFFAMEADDILKMIQNHELLEEHGLRENIADS